MISGVMCPKASISYLIPMTMAKKWRRCSSCKSARHSASLEEGGLIGAESERGLAGSLPGISLSHSRSSRWYVSRSRDLLGNDSARRVALADEDGEDENSDGCDSREEANDCGVVGSVTLSKAVGDKGIELQLPSRWVFGG